MTGAEFKTALGELGLPLGAKLTRRLLGLSERQLRYVAAGKCPLSRPVENMLGILLLFHRAGVPPTAVDVLLQGSLLWDSVRGYKAIPNRKTMESKRATKGLGTDWLKRVTPPGHS